MIKGVYDVESDGFLRELTHLHCLVIQDYDTLEVFAYHDHPQEFSPCDGSLEDGIATLNKLKVTVAHNQKNFDIKAMEKCRDDYQPDQGQISIDSLALSRLLFPEMRKDSIEAWAKKLKLETQKVQNDNWGHLSQNMLDRCISDVKINTAVIKYLWEIVDQQEAEGSQWFDALMTEQEVLYIHGDQTLHGVKYNVPLARATLKDFDRELLSLKDRITKGAPPVMSVPGLSGPKLEELRKVAKFSFCKIENLHKGVAQPFRKIKRKTVEKPFKINGGLTAMAQKVFVGKTWDYSDQMKTVKGSFSLYQHVDIKDRYNIHVGHWFDEDILPTVCGAFSKVEFKEINLNPDQQVKNFLYSLGWKPDEWNNKRMPDGSFRRMSPKLSESSFGSLPPGLGQDVKTYYTLKHRRSTIESIKHPETKGALAKVGVDHLMVGVVAMNFPVALSLLNLC